MLDVDLIKAIDAQVQVDLARKKGRTHLGASVLGRKCLRQIWYTWRWAHVTKHTGRLLRLFSRGHREEAALAGYLRSVGFEVRLHSTRLCYHDGSDSYADYPWEEVFPEDVDDVSDDPMHVARAESRNQGPKQYLFMDHDNHFGGSADGVLLPPPKWAELHQLIGPGLPEYKTHNEKSFTALAGKLEDWRKYVTDPSRSFTGQGVLSAKIEHYVQMQVYMHYLKLKWGLYVAVCKNTDDLYFEVIYYKPEIGEAYTDRAGAIIRATLPPARLSNNPDWWECKMCDFREICHRGAAMQVNCRSCAYAAPVENSEWRCGLHNQVIPRDFVPQGCGSWEQVGDV